MIRGALKPQYKKAFSVDSLRPFDDILQKNLEEFSGPPCVRQSAIEGAPAYLAKGRYQGLFACKDLIQHSCFPNCMTHAPPPVIEDGKMRLVQQIVPLRRISKGERLTWSYLPYWKLLWPTQCRRQVLSESWHFMCCCQRCTGPVREVTMAFICPA